MPKCEKLVVKFYFDHRVEDTEHHKHQATDLLPYSEISSYDRVLELPSSAKEITIKNCYQFIDPLIFQNAEYVAIKQIGLICGTSSRSDVSPPAPKLERLEIKGSYTGNADEHTLAELPAPFNAPRLKSLILEHCPVSYSYYFPQEVEKHHPNIESLEIYTNPEHHRVMCESSNHGPKSEDFMCVEFSSLKTLTLCEIHIIRRCCGPMQ